MNKLTTLKEIKAALSQPGARLVYDARCLTLAYFVEVNGVRTRCSKVAQNLTYAQNGFVKFSHRDALEIFWTVA